MLRTFVFAVTQSLNWTVRMSSQSPMQMVSVERIQRNTETPMEVALTSTAPEMPPFDWPTTGAERKVGIVARTGAEGHRRAGRWRGLEGLKFQYGEHQRLSIARALLMRLKSLSQDRSLDQHSVREEFQHYTALTIAHQIKTILYSYHVFVTEKSSLAEFGSQMELQRKPGDIFSIQHFVS
ncbi:hypothetical protein F441_10837 [Phytophthora nicotianae CJ01A1]|uniref:Uncharacterized protein n=1 Tax=Phytophthora nicotianae CJ01A1 TaxID=1317063 RepID=W2WXD9_PHYNI|nr:hypothetical protein F441_10837 [Phytophthora nicotianae CJ01A1]